MKVSKSSSGILSSGGNVIASDLTVDGTTVTVDESNNRLGVNTDTPQGTLGIDGDLFFQPTAISTSHIYATGSIDMRADANIKIGTETADSVKIGRTNTTAAKVHISSGTESDLVVSNSMVGIGTDSPDHTLSVAGDIDLTGGLSFDGGTAVESIAVTLSSVSASDDTLASAKAIKTYVDSVAGGGTSTSDLTDVSGTLAIANGGTGATSAANARTGLGLAIGSDVQAHDADLDTLSSCQSGGAAALAALTSTEIAILDGATLTTTELNYVDGVTSGIQAQIDAKGAVAGSSSIVTVGALDAGSITSGFGNIDIGSSTFDTTGAVGTGNLTAAGDIVATGGDLTLGTSADANNTTITAAAESGDNTSGKTLTIGGGLGTGTGVPGSVSITSAIPTSPGTGAHTAVTVAQFASEGPTLNYGGVANLLDNESVGEKVFFGTGQTVKGKLYYLNTSGAWTLADADGEGSTAALIAVACGGDGSGSANDAATHGMLIRGFIDNASYLTGTYNEGIPVYVDGTAGNMTITRPTSGFVRVIGWCCATANVIYFSPDNTYLEL